jgi:hypothetical protein
MDTIHITSGGSLYTILNRRCQMCEKIATAVVNPDWAPVFYVCSEHQVDITKEFLRHLPEKH